jgi:inhibitor of KinA sporulation pathway (predicted exonuclease)
MNNLIIFDLEATCSSTLPVNKREIIEIGAIKVVDGNIVDSFQSFVKPKRNNQLSNYCKSLTHIKQEQVDNALSPKDALSNFLTWAGEAIFASWGDFDSKIIQKELHKNKIYETAIIEFVNLQRMYMAVRKLPSAISLVDALKKERIENEVEQHRAYDDALNTYKIYKKNASKIDAMMTQYYSKLKRKA